MYLRPLVADDFKLLNRWLNAVHVRNFFGEPVDWLVEVQENMGHSDWIYYFIFETDRPIGFAQYYDTTKAPEGVWSGEPQGTAGIDYLIGEADALNKGYGTRIIKELLCIIRSKQSYQCVIADPAPSNKASARVLEKNGFMPRPSGLYKLHLTMY